MTFTTYLHSHWMRCCVIFLLSMPEWAGKTNIVVGNWNNFFTHIPINQATEDRRMVDLDGSL